MIGVLARAEQLAAAGELFELFKTPWEEYQSGRRYDVVIATLDDLPDLVPLGVPLLLLYGAGTKNTDRAMGFIEGPRRAGASLQSNGASVPVYGGLLTFTKDSAGTVEAIAEGGIAGLRLHRAGTRIIRLGYDLFDEVRHLLVIGQPVANAGIPALDLHIATLRRWILDAGVPLLEIPPRPARCAFTVCLTHDIDFVGIRRHRFDHTMWGFLYRSTVGAVRRVLQGRMGLVRLLKAWRAACSLPFVYLGWIKDFWEPFPWYLRVEKQLPATYFLIPFKNRVGDRVPGRHASRRATTYDVADIPKWTAAILEKGDEIGVHAIDAWHDADKGRAELTRVTVATGKRRAGTRTHWLLSAPDTPSVLEAAGFSYDASGGYNETIGYRHGTTQVFRPLGANTLLELPLHIQDGALFYPHNLDLSEPEAHRQCGGLVEHARSHGGVLSVLWHDRSHGPERFWGGFYVGLVDTLEAARPWFATASQAVGWFRARRQVRFERLDEPRGTRVRVCYDGKPIEPPLILRQHAAGDTTWNGVNTVDLHSPLQIAS